MHRRVDDACRRARCRSSCSRRSSSPCPSRRRPPCRAGTSRRSARRSTRCSGRGTDRRSGQRRGRGRDGAGRSVQPAESSNATPLRNARGLMRGLIEQLYRPKADGLEYSANEPSNRRGRAQCDDRDALVPDRRDVCQAADSGNWRAGHDGAAPGPGLRLGLSGLRLGLLGLLLRRPAASVAIDAIAIGAAGGAIPPRRHCSNSWRFPDHQPLLACVTESVAPCEPSIYRLAIVTLVRTHDLVS